jgi:murein DD-endopeptidase MepM/ murein hydrolase activator NlpD
MHPLLPALLAFALLAFAAACGDSGGTAGTPTATERPATPTLAPTPSPTPSPAPTPTPAPALDLSLSRPQQGGFVVIRLLSPPPGLNNLTAYFKAVGYPMVKEGDHWYRVVGLDSQFATGEYPIEVSSDIAAIAGGVLTVSDGGFEFVSIELPPSSIALTEDQDAAARERATLARVYSTFTAEQLWSGPWIWPTQGEISNAFGLQRSINGGPYSPHTGTDIANEKGTPVVAAASGRVALAEKLHYYGNVVVIDHGAGVFSSYNHLDAIAVTAGQAITIGNLVGYMGETGFVSGPHLHWEAVIAGVRTDPGLWVQATIDP